MSGGRNLGIWEAVALAGLDAIEQNVRLSYLKPAPPKPKEELREIRSLCL